MVCCALGRLDICLNVQNGLTLVFYLTVGVYLWAQSRTLHGNSDILMVPTDYIVTDWQKNLFTDIVVVRTTDQDQECPSTHPHYVLNRKWHNVVKLCVCEYYERSCSKNSCRVYKSEPYSSYGDDCIADKNSRYIECINHQEPTLDQPIFYDGTIICGAKSSETFLSQTGSTDSIDFLTITKDVSIYQGSSTYKTQDIDGESWLVTSTASGEQPITSVQVAETPCRNETEQVVASDEYSLDFNLQLSCESDPGFQRAPGFSMTERDVQTLNGITSIYENRSKYPQWCNQKNDYCGKSTFDLSLWTKQAYPWDEECQRRGFTRQDAA